MSIGSKVIRREWWHGHVSLSILFIINEESRLESFKTIVDGLNSHLSHCYGWYLENYSQQNYQVSTSVLYINAYV